MDPVIVTLTTIILVLLLFGIREYVQLKFAISKIPVRIHVNGSRGKSSVTRLIAAGLRVGGLKTIAKTTGSSPRIIDTDGKDQIIHRLRSASIGEQIRMLTYFSKQNPVAIVIECMAVQPQYQWISEQRMIQSTINVITNVRPDHLDEMGPTMDDITRSLGNTIPFNGALVTTEKKYNRLLREIAVSRNSSVETVIPANISTETMERFPYFEHEENVALALKVCHLVGVDEQTALKGMTKAKPDPGALVMWNLKFGDNENYFINAFAANDPQSTRQIWELVRKRGPERPTCVFLNSRSDRRARTKQLLQMVAENIQPEVLIIRGDNLPAIDRFQFAKSTALQLFSFSTEPEKVIQFLHNLDDHIIFGIGNIVGWGDKFIRELRRYKING